MNKEKLTGNNAQKRLDFLRSFCNFFGLEQSDIAEILGVCTQQVSYIFNTADDTRLSIVEKIFDKCGYELDINIVRTLDEEQIPTYLSTKNIVIKNGKYMLKRLFFLEEAMNRYGISRIETAKRLNISPAGVGYWFKTDDISISRLEEFCEAFNLKMKMKIKPKKEWFSDDTLINMEAVLVSQNNTATHK